MTIVFVHGVPETSAIWDPLLDDFGRDDVVTLSPPGFGAPVPDGFDATSDAYRDWLVGELERLDGPVDLIGHDWGGGHALRAAGWSPTSPERPTASTSGTTWRRSGRPRVTARRSSRRWQRCRSTSGRR